MSVRGRSDPHDETPRLGDLYLYPVKGARGARVERLELDDFGARGDRRWMMVGPDGVFVSQRELPALARIRAAYDDDVLVLSGAAHPTVSVRTPADDAARVSVRIWHDTTEAVDAGDEAAGWLASVLGRALRLVYMPDDVVRPVHPGFARPGDRVSFADGFPFLLISQAALDGLNERLATPLPMNRFRPNLVVDGVAAHAEDGWKRIAIGDVEVDIVKPCARCVVTTVNQDTGERGTEPLRTLAEYRRLGSNVMFGQNGIHRGRGMLRVGDPVRVLA
ncbi:MAG: MOSC domain-containing protein [Longimicrobiales bacterium]